MPSRGLCRQSSYARMLDFDPTKLCSMWTRADISGKLCRNKFMSDHCSGIAMWTRPWCLLHLSLSLDSADQDEAVWKCLGLSCPSAFSGTRPYTWRSISICSQHMVSNWTSCSLWRMCVLVRRFFERLIDRGSSQRGNCRSQAELKSLLAWIKREHLSGLLAAEIFRRSIMGSWLVRMPGLV